MNADQQAFEVKWHMKLVRPRGLHWKLPPKDYFVTAALLNQLDGETIVAIMAVDYSRENVHYITLHLAPEQLPKLEEGFEILGDYSPIDSEITFRVHGEGTTPDDREWWVTDTFNYANGLTTEACPLPKHMPLAIGSMVYDVCWTFTDGRKARETLVAPPEVAALGHVAVREHFKGVRKWICSGMYHFVDWRRLPGAPKREEAVA